MDYRASIVRWLADETGVLSEQIDDWLEIPPQPELGDFALPCFQLARSLHKAPLAIAKELAEQASVYLDRKIQVQVVGGYLNFFIDRASYISHVVTKTLKAGEQLGVSDEGEGKTVIVEFSSPNIAKPFHVGHAFTTILGHALYRLYDRLGYRVVRMNHLGDYGTQFGKLIVAYRLWGDETALQHEPINELLRIYVRFHDEAKDRPELESEARQAFGNWKPEKKPKKNFGSVSRISVFRSSQPFIKGWVWSLTITMAKAFTPTGYRKSSTCCAGKVSWSKVKVPKLFRWRSMICRPAS